MPPKLRNQIDSETLTIASIRNFVGKFLPSIRNEIKAEIDDMKQKTTSLTVKCIGISKREVRETGEVLDDIQ